jgi:hypothetical protein
LASQAGQAPARRTAQDGSRRQTTDAQFDLSKRTVIPAGALKAHVDSLTLDGQLFDAARNGDVATLAALLDKHPGS